MRALRMVVLVVAASPALAWADEPGQYEIRQETVFCATADDLTNYYRSVGTLPVGCSMISAGQVVQWDGKDPLVPGAGTVASITFEDGRAGVVGSAFLIPREEPPSAPSSASLKDWVVGKFTSPPSFIRPLSRAERVAIEAEVAKALLDPESARFRYERGLPMPPTKTEDGKEVVAYCFEVNAKNRMGGYVGFTTAIAVLEFSGGKFDRVNFATIAPSSTSRDLAELELAQVVYRGCQSALVAFTSAMLKEAQWRVEHGQEPRTDIPAVDD